MTHELRKAIPFAERFQHGRITDISRDICHVQLGKECHWARRARIRQDRLPPGKQFNEYRKGDQVKVFLLNPVREYPDTLHGSIAWGNKETNPWLTSPPGPGTLTRAEAIRYLDNHQGVFVRLENGIEALLRADEVPGGRGDVTRVIDLGDQLVVQVTAVWRPTLEVACSVQQALQTLQQKEDRKRKEEFSQQTVRLLQAAEYGLQPLENVRLAILGPDQWFNGQLGRWLKALGIFSVTANTSGQLLERCKALNHPTHVLSIPQVWGVRHQCRQLENLLKQRNIDLAWLLTSESQAPVPFSGPQLSMPLDVGLLVRWLQKSDFHPQCTPRQGLFRETIYQKRLVQKEADRLLGEICRHHDLAGALWIKQERPGIYIPLAFHGLDTDRVQSATPHLGQSLVATTIRENLWIFRPLSRSGPLRDVGPAAADFLCSMPLPYRALDGEERVQRAILFFYPFRTYPRKKQLEKILTPYMPAMQALLLADEYAEQNETLTTLANLGINSAAYLHEMGQATLPIRTFLDNLTAKANQLDTRELRGLKRELDKLLRLTRTNLAGIRKKRAPRILLRNRLDNIARLFAIRAGRNNCAFRVDLPDLPMVLALAPLFFDQAVTNLLDKGLHFVSRLPPGLARIQIRVGLDLQEDPARPLWIDIKDNGPGIRASMLSRIFQMRDTDKAIGTGMGLYITRSFVQALGGTIELRESIRWQRTVFRMRLPILLTSQIR